MEFIAHFLGNNPTSLLFLVIGLGYLLGQVRIKGFEVGTVAGVLLVGLIFGQFDYEISPAVQSLGFTLFIASVGYQAGPKFFNVFTLGLGIALGGLIGTLAISIGELSLGLGSAGGLLTAGLIVGYLRSIRPTFGRIPAAVIWLFMELGLLVFMTGVGLKAGQTLIETLQKVGPILLGSGVVVTIAPVVVGFLFGRYVLKLPPVLLMGGITGSMTSGASLKIVTAEAQSAMPALGYTGAYAFANVLLTIAGSLIIRL